MLLADPIQNGWHGEALFDPPRSPPEANEERQRKGPSRDRTRGNRINAY